MLFVISFNIEFKCSTELQNLLKSANFQYLEVSFMSGYSCELVAYKERNYIEFLEWNESRRMFGQARIDHDITYTSIGDLEHNLSQSISVSQLQIRSNRLPEIPLADKERWETSSFPQRIICLLAHASKIYLF